MYCLFLQHLAVLGVEHPWRFESSVYGKQALCKVFMEFIVLMYTIKCWYNTLLQVLTAAPALHSLIIRQRTDAARILEFLNHKHVDVRKLFLEHCSFTQYGIDVIDNIIALYPNLESLSLEGCCSCSSCSYTVIPHLKNLYEPNLSNRQVHYVCVKSLETRVWLCAHMWENTPRNAVYIFRQEGNLLHLKSCCIISVLFSTK
jgi:hypothetical protein